MSFILKSRIFSYFGVNSKVNDSYKDVNGKGLTERYQESVGEGYDVLLQDLIDNYIDRTVVPQTMLSRMIPFMESMLGDPVVVTNDVLMRRRIIRFAQHIYNIKSTKLSYEVLFKLLGFDTVDIQEFVIMSGFDSDVTLDDERRVFDGGNKACNDYSILLTGSITILPETLLAINRIVEFLEPINADLREILYNGVPIAVSGRYFDSYFNAYFG